MPIIQLIVLAIVQGITEFLPISSSAHLIIAPMLVDSWSDQGPVMDVAAHVGSLFAVLLYFKKDTQALTIGAINTVRLKQGPERNLFLFMLAASLPLLSVGAVIAITGIIDHLRSPMVIGISSIVFGALLWHGDTQKGDTLKNDAQTKTATKTPPYTVDNLTWRHAMIVGFSQILSLIPGASRSGVTMTAARYLGWTRPQAARFSMLLAIPTIAALGLFACIDIFTGNSTNATPMGAFIMAILSFFAAYVSIAFLMKLVQSVSFTPFVIYRIIFGIGLIAFAIIGGGS